MQSVTPEMKTIAAGIAGLVLFVVLILSGASVIRNRDTASSGGFVLETPDMAAGDGGADPQPTPLPDPQFGEASPDSPVEANELAAVEPQPGSATNEAQPAPRKGVELARPIPVSAGKLAFGSRSIQLDGLVPAKPAQACTDRSGRKWPCGMIGRTALRNFLRARTVTCSVENADWPGTVVADCSLAGQDLAEWLAKTGWAEAQPGSRLEPLTAAAKAAEIGMFGPDPRTTTGQ